MKTRHIAYLGKNPVDKLKKLIREERFTEEQVAKITFANDYSREGYDLYYWLQGLRRRCSELKRCPNE